jgi:hypothetical protein
MVERGDKKKLTEKYTKANKSPDQKKKKSSLPRHVTVSQREQGMIPYDSMQILAPNHQHRENADNERRALLELGKKSPEAKKKILKRLNAPKGVYTSGPNGEAIQLKPINIDGGMLRGQPSQFPSLKSQARQLNQLSNVANHMVTR